MKRTQLYLDEDMARTLSSLSRQRGTTVSELVRESVREKYMKTGSLDRIEIARQISGIWSRRRDLKNVDKVVRNLRKGSRRTKGLTLA